MADDDERRPWDSPGVRGVVPPGRRLPRRKPSVPDPSRRGLRDVERPSVADHRGQRKVAWAASGVKGVVPPGKLGIGEGPATDWVMAKAKQRPKARPKPPPAKGSKAAPNAERPTVGFIPNVLADEPDSLKAFLDEIAVWIRDNRPDDSASTHLAELIGQSHAPYELVVGFTTLSALIGSDTAQRNNFAWALERGAKAFYNLAMRLDSKVKAPRGLAPQRLDPIFYDLPATAYQIPYAFATDAFVRILDLLRGELGHDRKLVRFARDLYERYVAQRSYGDKPLAELFIWDEPPWAPAEDD